MSPPGADTSGLSWCPNAVGPAEEKIVTTPPRSVWIWRICVSILIWPRPDVPASATRSRSPSRSEIIPEGTAVSTGITLGRPGAVVHEHHPDPACFPHALGLGDEGAVTARDERDRAGQRAGRKRVVRLRSDRRHARRGAGRRLAVTADDRADVDERLVALNPTPSGALGVPPAGGNVAGVRGRPGAGLQGVAEDVVVGHRGDGDRVGRRSGAAVRAEPKSSRSLPAEMTGTTPAWSRWRRSRSSRRWPGSVSGLRRRS